MVPLRENVDGAGRIRHDLPRLKRHHDPVISCVDHDDRGLAIVILTGSDRLDILRELDLVRPVGVVSSRGEAIFVTATLATTSSPLTTRLAMILYLEAAVLTPPSHSSSKLPRPYRPQPDRQKNLPGPRRSP